MTYNAGLNRLIELSKLWSFGEALWILQVYKCGHHGVNWRNFWTTPHDIGIVLNKNCSAAAIKVKFFGGPFRRGCEFAGSFSMFVVDRVLHRWKYDDIGWTWLLHFNPDTLTTLQEQLGHIKPCYVQKVLPGFEDERAGHYEPPTDYESGERVIDYVQIGDKIYPILESGRQGSAALLPAERDDGAVHRWSSSGRVGECEGV